MSEALVAWLGRTSVDVAALVVLVAVALWAFGRALSPRWRYALWAVVVLRLCVPVVPQLRPSATDLPRALAEPAAELGSVAKLVVTRRRPRPTPEATPEEPPTVSARTAPRAPHRAGTEAATEPPPASVAPFPWRGGLLLGWAGGAAVVLLTAFRRERAFRRALRGARPVADPRVRDLLARGARAMGTRVPELVETDRVAAPALFGLRRPRLLLPEDATATLSEAELELVFLHELAHARHRDVLTNVALVVLRAAWWFHPFARLAFREFSRAQESVRDWEALRAAGRGRSASYARTLLKLVQAVPPRLRTPRAVGFLHGNSLERRIQMIARFERPHRRWLGAALLAGVAGFGLTSASREAAPAPQEGDDGLRRVQVERPARPAWRDRMLERLSMPIQVELEQVEVGEFVEFLRAVTGMNFVLLRDGWEQAMDEGLELTMRHSGSTLDALGALYAAADYLDWSLEEDIVVIGPTWRLPNAYEVAVYAVEPHVEVAGFDAFVLEDEEYQGDDLVDRVVQFTGDHDRGAWDHEGTWIEPWGDVLVVNHTPRMHAEVERFLNLLLNEGRTPATAEPAWKRELEAALAAKGSVRFEGVEVLEALEQFEVLSGVHVHVTRTWWDDHGGDGEEVDLALGDVSWGRILDWLAVSLDARVRLANGRVELTDEVPVETRVYRIGRLLAAMTADDESDDPWHELDRLSDLLRQKVDPESWDEQPGMAIEYWADLMVVGQSPSGHAQIGPILESLERAFRR